MQTSRYEAPSTLAGALSVMAAEPGAMVLAGGTDLLVQYQAGVRKPTVFVDVKRVPELMQISADDTGVTIGAAAPASDICAHPVIRQFWPGLVEAVHLIGSTQIQGRASLGGNLCNGSPAADSTCALIVNRAVAVVVGAAGERQVPVEQFVVAPGKTVLTRGELLVSVRLPRPAPHTGDAYQRLIPRSEMDIAVASAGVSLTLDANGVCTAARVSIGAVAPTALLLADAAAALIGSTLDAVAIGRAAAAASAAARPIDDKRGTVAYRRTVAGVLTKRVATIAAARAKER
jgi:carbon-monoxide dehydrogenase medium subunit